jgi:hypothetical protein
MSSLSPLLLSLSLLLLLSLPITTTQSFSFNFTVPSASSPSSTNNNKNKLNDAGTTIGYVDGCVGKQPQTCLSLSKTLGCIYSIDDRGCFNEFLLDLTPPEDIDVSPSMGLASKFFAFNFGVFLSEGTWTKVLYNLDVNECADACLRSTSTSNIRCLAFNFFPFEEPWYSAPWQESIWRGICELLSSNADFARLRNEDEGLTDAELFYASHFTNRPFSDLAGYYELRDPRGGRMSQLLDYDGEFQDSQQADSTITSSLWPRSRWGIFHIKAPKGIRMPQCKTTPTTSVTSKPDEMEYVGGFTPVDDNAHCTGRVTKDQAQDLCVSAGGRLCTSNELTLLQGRQLGCSLDSYDVWSSEDSTTTTTTTGNNNNNKPPPVKFARCCASYVTPTSCDYYTSSRWNFCESLDNLPDCIKRGSGAWRQSSLGFGNYVANIRGDCASKRLSTCRGVLVTDWAPRDYCVWCVKPGSKSAGECRIGNSYGVCPNAATKSRVSFATSLSQHCGIGSLCALSKFYSDWNSVVVN